MLSEYHSSLFMFACNISFYNIRICTSNSKLIVVIIVLFARFIILKYCSAATHFNRKSTAFDTHIFKTLEVVCTILHRRVVGLFAIKYLFSFQYSNCCVTKIVDTIRYGPFFLTNPCCRRQPWFINRLNTLLLCAASTDSGKVY